MKRIYLLIIALLTITIGSFAQTRTWTGPATGGNWNAGSNWSGNTVPANGTAVVFNTGFSGTVTNVQSVQLASLRVEAGSNVTFNVTADRTIDLRGGSSATPRLFIGSGSALTLEGNGTSDIVLSMTRTGGGGGNILGTIDGTLVVGTNSTFDIDNGNTIVTVSDAIEVSTGSSSVSSTTTSLSFASGSFYRHQRNGGSIPTATWNAASTVEVTGVTNTTPGGFNQNFGNLTWNNPSQSAGIRSLAGSLETVNGNLDVVSTGAGSFALKISGTPATTTDVFGNFNLSGGTMYIIETSGTQTLSVRGNVNLTGGTLARGGSGTANFLFSRNGLQTYTRTSTTISGPVNFTVNEFSQVDFGTSIVSSTGSFTLESGAKIITSSDDGLRSTGAFGNIQTTTRTYDGNADYEFRGATTGNFATNSGGGNNVRDLIINRAAGQVTMNKSFVVNRALTLTNGYVTPGANTLQVVNAGTSTSANGAFVNGSLQKVYSGSGAAFTFFVGDAATVGLRSIGFTPVGGSGTSTFTARFLRADANTAVGNTLGSGVARVSACEYWTLGRAVGSGAGRTGTVTLSWAANSHCGNPAYAYITNLLTLRAVRYDGASWINAGGNVVGGSSNSVGSFTTASQSAFTTFALGSSAVADNPLPVLFDGVKAYGKNDGVQLEWSNLTERDIVRYEVERSSNGVDFYAINQQAPKSNRDDKASYTHFDASPINGANFYRIRVDEIGGKPVYSKILRVEMGSTKVGFSLYPNPVVGKQLTVSLSGLRQGQYSLQVYNTAGQRVYTTNINNVGSGVTQMIELPASLKTGVYVTVVSGDSYQESKQFILK